jgi:hypothetical protein
MKLLRNEKCLAHFYIIIWQKVKTHYLFYDEEGWKSVENETLKASQITNLEVNAVRKLAESIHSHTQLTLP